MMVMIVGFILGVLSVLAFEIVVIVYVFQRLTQKSSKSPQPGVSNHPLDQSQSLVSVYQKQGAVWILEPEKISKISGSAEQFRKSDILEVSPVRKFAKIKDRTLILTEQDGSITKVTLKGCQVVAVSATSLPTRKWAKRYPVKVESKTTVLYHGSKVLYIYAETSWEKESWCKALRLASSDDKVRQLWFSKLNDEFRRYLRSLTEGYPSLMKPSSGYHGGPLDKANRLDDPPSKVRQLWRKLSKKASVSNHDDRRNVEKSFALQDPAVSSIRKTAGQGKVSNGCVEDGFSVSSGSTHSASSSHISEISDADPAEKFVIDEGTLCWNLIISRLFFDAKNNADVKTSLKARIQRTLSNMRTPSYIGEVTCIDLDPGSLPPYIQGMRAVPTDMNDLWALEMDIEYSGGVVLYIEARLDVGELDANNSMGGPNMESSSVEARTDLLQDFKHLQEELKLSDGAVDSVERKDAADSKFDKLRSSRIGVSTANAGSRWKSLLSSVAKHVSQVPLTLAIRVAALRGTIQLHIKPPPSDQLWFGFTSMPDIHFQLESAVKDHKITSGRVASFLINRFKASIQETLVLPNCESACISWMLAEKDDWVPRNAAPLMWLNKEAHSEPTVTTTTNSTEASNSQSSGGRKGGDHQSEKGGDHQEDSTTATTKCVRSSSDSSMILSRDLTVPLLQNEETRDGGQRKEENPEHQSPSRYVSLREQRSNVEEEDGKAKRVGRRARMFDLGKKMGEKIEEKRRHIEEKSRNIVEKMRAT